MNPRYPVYVVSKGRYTRRPTANMLESLGIPYYIIVEDFEAEEYSKVVKGDVLVLPEEYKKDYDMWWNDGGTKTGPGPARNFAMDHSTLDGYSRHWVLDDNIESLERFNNNMKVRCLTGTPMYVMEDFVSRYSNIAMAGPNYAIFCPAYERRPPVVFNTRIYSFILLDNGIPFRWRGRYNEDTDLSLRILKSGMCTAQFNAFLQGKRATQTVRGGNSAEFYDEEGTENKSKMLVEMHPDVARMVIRFNRAHHYVSYRSFKAKNKLERIVEVPEYLKGVNNYGMVLKKIK